VLDKPQITGLFSEFLTLKHDTVFKVSYLLRTSFANGTGGKCLEKVFLCFWFFWFFFVFWKEASLEETSYFHRKITDIYENGLESRD